MMAIWRTPLNEVELIQIRSVLYHYIETAAPDELTDLFDRLYEEPLSGINRQVKRDFMAQYSGHRQEVKDG